MSLYLKNTVFHHKYRVLLTAWENNLAVLKHIFSFQFKSMRDAESYKWKVFSGHTYPPISLLRTK